MEDLRSCFSESIVRNIAYYKQIKARKACFSNFPSELTRTMISALQKNGIHHLYSHQTKSISAILKGNNVVITSGVASGKSLCYQIPILQTLEQHPQARFLLLFPTKALTQDQGKSFSDFMIKSGFKNKIGIYDGDTPKDQRSIIRQHARVIFSNPDMIHLGLLPHHTKWKSFFANLSYIVIDEIHIYRGIFGSHFTNVMRRLLRIAAFYGSKPKFILTSATISNVQNFAEKLINAPVKVIEEDGSPQPEKHILFYNPPIVNKELGIRRNVLLETVHVGNELIKQNFQALIFSDSRRSVELILKYLQHTSAKIRVKSYRSGYLPQERRKLEQQLKQGKLQAIVSTNALELGIDIGALDCILISGYPGSIASMKQQMGRAGRTNKKSISVFVASSKLMDQYVLAHPDFFLQKEPEEALIDPDNPYILLEHFRCALFEKPFEINDTFGNLDAKIVNSYLQFLVKMKTAYQSGNTYFWKSSHYPAQSVSLRTIGHSTFTLLANGTTLGLVDGSSVFWMCHPKAIYLHSGETYFVKNLNLEKNIVLLEKVHTDYYTQSQRKTTFEVRKVEKDETIIGGTKKLGTLKVTEEVIGFKKIAWHTHENLGTEKLDLPPQQMNTIGCWFSIHPFILTKLQKAEKWKPSQVNYGKNWTKITRDIRKRDHFTCQHCGKKETEQTFHVHHKKAIRTFQSNNMANQAENLITLCPSCHQLAERQQYMQSGMAGLTYLLHQIAPLFLMCDHNDIHFQFETNSSDFAEKNIIIAYDAHPGGIGLAKKFYEIYYRILWEAYQVVLQCTCQSGCPACVGPVAEQGEGSKNEVKMLLRELLKHERRTK